MNLSNTLYIMLRKWSIILSRVIPFDHLMLFLVIKMRNYEVLREKPAYERDIYSELKRIEERGKRKKQNRKGKILRLFRTGSTARTA